MRFEKNNSMAFMGVIVLVAADAVVNSTAGWVVVVALSICEPSRLGWLNGNRTGTG